MSRCVTLLISHILIEKGEKCKAFNDQEPPRGESINAFCGGQLLSTTSSAAPEVAK